MTERTRPSILLVAERAVPPAAVDAWVAAILALGLGVNIVLIHSIRVSLVMAALLLPVWVGSVLRDGRLFAVLTVGLLAVGGGWIQAIASSATHSRSFNGAVEQTLLLVTLVMVAGALTWACATIGAPPALLAYGIGLLITVFLTGGYSGTTAWKYNLSIPVTIVVLAAAWWAGRLWAQMAALALLVVVNVVFSARSGASMILIAFVILVWQWARRELRLRSTVLRTALAALGLGILLYNVVKTAILQGWLGAAAQQRSQQQIDASGSLILGGRPELGATFALLRSNPWGFGLGILPNFNDIYIAKSGMKSLNYSPNNGYVDKYMFGDGFEVHSGLGDLWLRFGFMGAVFGLLAVIVVLWCLIHAIVAGTAPALWVLLGVQAAWQLMFGPFYLGSMSVLVAALALSADETRRARNRRAWVSDEVASPSDGFPGPLPGSGASRALASLPGAGDGSSDAEVGRPRSAVALDPHPRRARG